MQRLLSILLPTAEKSFFLNVAEFLDPSLKSHHAWKLVWFRMKTSLFLLFQNAATFIENHCVFLCYFLQYDEVFFWSAFYTFATTILFL